MKAVLVNFRQGRHHQKCNHMVLKVEGVSDRKKAESLIGKTVTWTTPAKRLLKGKITHLHGNSGAVRVRFEQGMPGQSVGTPVVLE